MLRKYVRGRYVVSLIGALILLFNTIAINAVQAQPSMLHVSGLNIENASNQVVQLQGANLGAWLVMEGWMCPMDSSGSIPDMYSAINELDSRFGVAEEQSLISDYQSAWITTSDLQNIKNQGLNCVRCPVWLGDFYTLSGSLRSDAFTKLDWLVSNCATIGLYVVIDMHGVFGGQANNQDTGQEGVDNYWTNTTDQSETSSMWSAIAAHYNGNSTVAGYDLINEPTGTPSSSTYFTLVNGLYNTVRAADPSHICFIESYVIPGTWASMPAPSTYGWTNTAYSMHEYEYNSSDSTVQSGSLNQVDEFQANASWDVPDFIGEFNDFQYSDAWAYTVPLWNKNDMSWTMWAYKATHGVTPDSWGLYDVSSSPPPVPNLTTATSATIAADWEEWTTPTAFTLNTTLSAIVVGGGGTTGSAPSTPTGLTATSGNAQVALSWTAASGATAYNLYRSTTSGGQGTTPVTTGIASTTYTNTGLTNGTTYYFTVAAVNAYGTSAQSPQASATPAVTVAAAPTGLTALAGNAKIALSWTASSGATTYDVYRGTSSGGESTTPVATGVTSTGYTNTGLTNGTAYYYTVSAVDSAGTSAKSNEASATPSATGPIPNGTYTLTPQNATGSCVDATNGSTSSGTQIQIWATTAGDANQEWIVTNEGGGSYLIQPSYDTSLAIGVAGSGTANGTAVDLLTNTGASNELWTLTAATGGYTLTPANAPATTMNVSGPSSSNGTLIQIWAATGGTNTIFAFNAAGSSAPAAPTGLTAAAGNAQVTLSWTASTGATSYNIYRGTSSGSESSTAIATGITSTNYTNTGLSNGTTYYYKVAAVNANGSSALSSEASATPSASGGPITNGTYDITPQNATGSRLDGTGGGTTNGTSVQIWQYSAGDANQHWTFTNTIGSIYTIQPAYDTALAMEVSGGGSANGTAVVLWASNGSTAEQWAATAATGGYTFTPQCATGTTLNVTGQSSSNGALMQIWQATGGTNTIFALSTAN